MRHSSVWRRDGIAQELQHSLDAAAARKQRLQWEHTHQPHCHVHGCHRRHLEEA